MVNTSSFSKDWLTIWTPESNSPHTITRSSGSARVLIGLPVQKGLLTSFAAPFIANIKGYSIIAKQIKNDKPEHMIPDHLGVCSSRSPILSQCVCLYRCGYSELPPPAHMGHPGKRQWVLVHKGCKYYRYKKILLHLIVM